MDEIKEIFIYSDYPSKEFSTEFLIDYLTKYGFPVRDRGNLFEFLNLTQKEFRDVARNIAGTKDEDIYAQIDIDKVREQGYEEIELELKKICGKESYIGALYDGFWLQRIFYGTMAPKIPDQIGSGFVHLIFTSRLFGTFETKRYHARVVLTGLPSLISTSGVVEAPARPKEYYWLKAGLLQGGKDIRELDLMYKGRFVEYDDPRLSQILSSYALQPIFYEITGNPFCDDPSCCLYNSHWQQEVLKAQLMGKLCDEHKDIILKFSRK